MVLFTFAESKVNRLPGRNPATLGHANHSSEGNITPKHKGKDLERLETLLIQTLFLRELSKSLDNRIV